MYQLTQGQKFHCLVQPLKHINLPILSTLFVNLCCRCLSHLCHCLTGRGRESLSVQHTSLSSQRDICRNTRPLSTQPTNTCLIRFFTIGHQWGMSSNMLRTVKSKGPASNKVWLKWKVWTDLWHVLPETLTKLRELMQEKEINNSPDMSRDG